MPRRPRLFLPGQPQHIVVRGHNREAVFLRNDDFRYFYRCLRRAVHDHAIAVHAWVFMHNHIHLLVTPDDEKALPKTMQSIGRCYAQYFNRHYQRSGSLWEGRYKSSLVETDDYLLSCYRYIELNPVRAGIVEKPADYAYSSYHANALGKPDPVLSPHTVFTDFISVDAAKESGRSLYKNLCAERLDSSILMDIRRGTEKGSGIGSTDFLRKVARLRVSR